MKLSTAMMVSVTMLLCACSAKQVADSATTAEPAEASMTVLKLELNAEPESLAMADRGEFKVGFTVTNLSDKTVDPKIWESVLTVSGERCYAWDLAAQNGPRDDSWSAVAPGATVSGGWPLGEAMFPKPGTYDVMLVLGSQQASAKIRVTP